MVPVTGLSGKGKDKRGGLLLPLFLCFSSGVGQEGKQLILRQYFKCEAISLVSIVETFCDNWFGKDFLLRSNHTNFLALFLSSLQLGYVPATSTVNIQKKEKKSKTSP